METRPGSLLGGRVVHAQPVTGHRTGIEPVLLAASIAARPGHRVLEGGSGAGAGLLCLACRVPGIAGVGIERDAVLVGLAGENAAANGLGSLQFIAGDLAAVTVEGGFDHAMANPPWHRMAGTTSPDAGKDSARRTRSGLFASWAQLLAAALRVRGTLTFVVAASVLADCVAAFGSAGCGSVAVLPLWPKPGREARLVLVRGIKGGRGPSRVLPGLVLHRDEGGYTATAHGVLWLGDALSFGDA